MLNSGLEFSAQLVDGWLIEESLWHQRMKVLEPEDPSEATLRLLISCLDLTSLSATDTKESIDVLLSKALQPLAGSDLKVGGVCVYQPFVARAVTRLEGSGIAIATVAGGFPAGQMDLEVKCADIAKSVHLGATEIDAVICRSAPLCGDWKQLYREVAAMKQACGGAKLKVIIGSGDLRDALAIYKTSLVCLMGGADVIKTSTGMEAVNATPEAAFWMLKAIREYRDICGYTAGFKPAGGIKTTEQAMQYHQLLEMELGSEYLHPDFFRIGASSLLDDVLVKIEDLRS
jgi:deoxyribose-phosphate aldolase